MAVSVLIVEDDRNIAELLQMYLEDTDDNGRKRLDAAVKELGLTMTAAPLPETNWAESWKDNYRCV